MQRPYRALTGLLACLLASNGQAQTSLANQPVRFSGFVEGYYAYDFNSPPNGDRAFTTQPARDNEFNINLAFVEAILEREKTRGRFALQAGTSVQSNYSAEPTRGSVSGGELSRHIQEARIGYKVGTNTWLDGGVFFAHVGSESFISRDNLTLTRSLVADYSPYYLSGVKLTHSFNERLTGLLLVTNGWQNISENNKDKTIGTGIEYAAETFSIAYNTLIGTEISPPLQGVDRRNTFRHFHNLILKSKNLGSLELIGQYDLGFQDRREAPGESSWAGATLMARYKLNDTQGVSARIEHYRDADQVVVVTGRDQGMSAFGGSIGFDQNLDTGFVWRTEIRHLNATSGVFPNGSNDRTTSNTTATTSIALSLSEDFRMDFAIAGFVSVAVLVYLIFTLIYPEKF